MCKRIKYRNLKFSVPQMQESQISNSLCTDNSPGLAHVGQTGPGEVSRKHTCRLSQHLIGSDQIVWRLICMLFECEEFFRQILLQTQIGCQQRNFFWTDTVQFCAYTRCPKVDSYTVNKQWKETQQTQSASEERCTHCRRRCTRPRIFLNVPKDIPGA